MINFDAIQDAAGWAKLAQTIINSALDGAKGRDMAKMKQASSDLLDFLQNRTSDCPRAVVDAVFGAQTEADLAIATASEQEIANATAQLSAFIVDVQRVSADLNQKAALIKLEPVVKTLDSVTALVAQAKSLQSKLNQANPANIDLPGLQSDVNAILTQLANIVIGLKQATGQS